MATDKHMKLRSGEEESCEKKLATVRQRQYETEARDYLPKINIRQTETGIPKDGTGGAFEKNYGHMELVEKSLCWSLGAIEPQVGERP